MITILVKSDGDATLEYPEYQKIPYEQIADVIHHIKTTKNPVIRTCAPDTIELIGEMIYEKMITRHHVQLFVENVEYFYNDAGCLNTGWPYGYFLRGSLRDYGADKSHLDLIAEIDEN